MLESLTPSGAISRSRCRASPSRSGRRSPPVSDDRRGRRAGDVLQADWESPDARQYAVALEEASVSSATSVGLSLFSSDPGRVGIARRTQHETRADGSASARANLPRRPAGRSPGRRAQPSHASSTFDDAQARRERSRRTRATVPGAPTRRPTAGLVSPRTGRERRSGLLGLTRYAPARTRGARSDGLRARRPLGLSRLFAVQAG